MRTIVFWGRLEGTVQTSVKWEDSRINCIGKSQRIGMPDGQLAHLRFGTCFCLANSHQHMDKYDNQ